MRPDERIHLPFHQAALDKWREARPADDEWEPRPWSGYHPLIEAHEELLDLHNYLHMGPRMVERRWPPQRSLRKARRLVEQLAELWPHLLKEAGLLRPPVACTEADSTEGTGDEG